MKVDVRLLAVALLVLAVCLTVGFVRIALAIRRDYVARFARIRQQLEEHATALISGLFRRDQ